MTPGGPRTFPQRRDWLLLATGLALLLVFCLGARGLNEPDEGRYANIARAMVLSGDWWEPRVSGFGHYDKPPLVYWTTAASLRVFGMNEWAARVPSLLGAVLTLLGLAWAAWRLRGERIAWWSVLICGTSVQFFLLARILSPDMLLTGWCTLAIGAWAECRHRGGAWGWWLASLGCWTLAWWTKATPVFIPLAGLWIGLLATGDAAGRRALRVWLVFPAILVLGAAWFLSMMSHYPELKNFFFGRELAGRMSGHADGRRGSKAYYLGISALAWLPWWPLAAWSAWSERRGFAAGEWRTRLKAGCVRLGVEGWIVVTGLIIFSLAASKLPTYTLTLAPWAALGMARRVCRLAEHRANPGAPFRPAAVAAGAFALVVVAGALIVPRYESALGVNSSLRTVSAFLRAHGATRVDADQYWPGLEFYLGDGAVHYVMRHGRQQERTTDPGLPPARFIDPRSWPALETGSRPPPAPAANSTAAANDAPAGAAASIPAPAAHPPEPPTDIWLVLFRRRQTSPFDETLAGARGETAGKTVVASTARALLARTIGQFELVHVSLAADGKLTILPIAP